MSLCLYLITQFSSLINALVPIRYIIREHIFTVHLQLRHKSSAALPSDHMLVQTYLSLREAQVDSQLGFPPDGDVSVEVKLLLQL